MLYDGAIKFLEQAEKSLSDEDTEMGHAKLIRAQKIITELRCELNFDAGDVARALADLYDYMHERLIQANVQKSIEPIKEVSEMLSSLRESWVEAAAMMASSRQPSADEVAR